MPLPGYRTMKVAVAGLRGMRFWRLPRATRFAIKTGAGEKMPGGTGQTEEKL
jgi:hypothetical protein